MLFNLEAMEQQIAGYKRDITVSIYIATRRHDLKYRGGELQASIG